MKNRTIWPRWTTAILVGLPIISVLSFGTTCCLTRCGVLSNDLADSLYRPVLKFAELTPAPVEDAVNMLLFGHSAKVQRLYRLFNRLEGLEIDEPQIGYRSAAGWKELAAKRDRLKAARSSPSDDL